MRSSQNNIYVRYAADTVLFFAGPNPIRKKKKCCDEENNNLWLLREENKEN